MTLPRRRSPAQASRARGAHPRRSGSATARSRPRSSRARRASDGSNEFVFYDGPPFANGLPHYGHLLTGFVKDVVPRYQTMRGQRVERRFGWDCHGLPAEIEAEKELGVSGHRDDHRVRHRPRSTTHCRTVGAALHRRSGSATSPARPAGSTSTTTTRPWTSPTWRASCGRSRQLWDKGLVYEGYRVLPYCWRCETPLSNSETRLDDAYRDRARTRRSPSRFQLEPADGEPGPPTLLAWTTTPWTLPSNLALAVGPDIDYARLRGRRRALRSSPRPRVERLRAASSRRRHVVGTVKGAELVGRTLRAAVPLLRRHAERRSRCSPADFVDHRGGHRRRAHGARLRRGRPDRRATPRASRWSARSTTHGRFTAEVPAVGRACTSSTPTRTSSATSRPQASVVRHETYDHTYPHCWRYRHAARSTGRCRRGS